jgi:hypothetical protein
MPRDAFVELFDYWQIDWDFVSQLILEAIDIPAYLGGNQYPSSSWRLSISQFILEAIDISAHLGGYRYPSSSWRLSIAQLIVEAIDIPAHRWGYR